MKTLKLTVTEHPGRKSGLYTYQAIHEGKVVYSTDTNRVYVAIALYVDVKGQFYPQYRFGRVDLIGKGDSKWFIQDSPPGSYLARVDFVEEVPPAVADANGVAVVDVCDEIGDSYQISASDYEALYRFWMGTKGDGVTVDAVTVDGRAIVVDLDAVMGAPDAYRACPVVTYECGVDQVGVASIYADGVKVGEVAMELASPGGQASAAENTLLAVRIEAYKLFSQGFFFPYSVDRGVVSLHNKLAPWMAQAMTFERASVWAVKLMTPRITTDVLGLEDRMKAHDHAKAVQAMASPEVGVAYDVIEPRAPRAEDEGLVFVGEITREDQVVLQFEDRTFAPPVAVFFDKADVGESVFIYKSKAVAEPVIPVITYEWEGGEGQVVGDRGFAAILADGVHVGRINWGKAGISTSHHENTLDLVKGWARNNYPAGFILPYYVDGAGYVIQEKVLRPWLCHNMTFDQAVAALEKRADGVANSETVKPV